jgi:hypothetical protein
MGQFLGNPLAVGVPTNTATVNANRQPFPVQLSFGVPVYGTQRGVTGTTGTASFGPAGYGTAGLTTAAPPSLASGIGVRRAPAYTTALAFDHQPRATEMVRGDLQAILARSSRLPSRDRIRVTMNSNTVVLRGRVTTEHERRLAEALVRLTPGVREVRNELVATQKPKPRP